MRKKRIFEFNEAAHFEQREKLAEELEADIQSLQIAKQSIASEIKNMQLIIDDAIQDRKNEYNLKFNNLADKERKIDEVLAEYNRQIHALKDEIEAFNLHKKSELAKIEGDKKIVANGIQENIDRRTALEDAVIAANKVKAESLVILEEAKRIRQEGEDALVLAAQQLEDARNKNSNYETEMAVISSKRKEIESEKDNLYNQMQNNLSIAKALNEKELSLVEYRQKTEKMISDFEAAVKNFNVEKEEVLVQKRQNEINAERIKNDRKSLDNRENIINERERLFSDKLNQEGMS